MHNHSNRKGGVFHANEPEANSNSEMVCCNRVITFDNHLKTALLQLVFTLSPSFSPFRFKVMLNGRERQLKKSRSGFLQSYPTTETEEKNDMEYFILLCIYFNSQTFVRYLPVVQLKLCCHIGKS